MDLEISGNRTLKELIDDFNYHFPHLKLEFFKHQHKEEEASPKNDIFPHHLTVNEIRTTTLDGNIEFDEKLTISEFENIMRDDFGLNIQIFRRSGNLWLETTTSDKWTLAKAEKEGREMDLIKQKTN